MHSDLIIDRGDINDSIDREIAVLMDASELADAMGEQVGAAYAKAALDGGDEAKELLERVVAEQEEALLLESVGLLL